MRLSAVAVMEMEGEKFKVLNYKPLFRLQKKEVLYSKQTLQSFLDTLASENFETDFIEGIESAIKHRGHELFRLPGNEMFLDFQNKGKKYKIYFKQEDDAIFGYLLYKLSSAEIKDIESKKIMEYSPPDDEKSKDSDISGKDKTLH